MHIDVACARHVRVKSCGLAAKLGSLCVPRSACITSVSSRTEAQTISPGVELRILWIQSAKALHLNGLLPRVMSGTSAGSIVYLGSQTSRYSRSELRSSCANDFRCGMLGVRTDEELWSELRWTVLHRDLRAPVLTGQELMEMWQAALLQFAVDVAKVRKKLKKTMPRTTSPGPTTFPWNSLVAKIWNASLAPAKSCIPRSTWERS